MFIARPLNDILTTYIVFETNMVGFVFDNSTESFNLINVELGGDFSSIRTNKRLSDINPMVYSSSNIIRSALGCCTCLSYSLSVYDIENIDYPDPTNGYDQIFSVFSFETHGGHVDAVKSRVYHWGRNTINIYSVSNGLTDEIEPDLEP